MYDFIVQHGDTIIQFLVTISVLAPFLRQRGINDKNIIDIFGEVKQKAMQIDLKEIDFRVSQEAMRKTLNKIETDVQQQIVEMKNSINEFKEDEFYKKMENGLSQLDELNEIIKQKDNLIAKQNEDMKKITIYLETLINERKL
jgi:hypothetical protein